MLRPRQSKADILSQLFSPKEKMADYLESYATLLDLNVWTDSTLVSADFDAEKKQWTLRIERKKDGDTYEIGKFCSHS